MNHEPPHPTSLEIELAAASGDMDKLPDKARSRSMELARLNAADLARRDIDAEVRAILAEANTTNRRVRAIGALAAMIALSLGVAYMRPSHPTTAPSSDSIRAKGLGAHTLELTSTERGRERVLADGDVVTNGTIIRIHYRTDNLNEVGAILSIDALGHLTMHSPDEPFSLEANRAQTLPRAFKLDSAPGFEHFIFLSSTSRADITNTLHQLEAAARDASPAALRHATDNTTVDAVHITLFKEQTR